MITELLIVTISLFAIVDPLTSIPVFISFFGDSKIKRHKRAAFNAILAAFILLLIFSLFGIPLLTYLNISISAFMIAGGLLLLYLAFEFLLGELPRSRRIEKDPSDAVVPIGTPLLAGPGAITSAMYFTHIYGFYVTFLAIVIVMIISFLCLALSTRINRVLGKNGLKVFTRIMGLITAAIAVSLIEKALVAYGLIPALI
jgi:multiple antibiotic resistance protein